LVFISKNLENFDYKLQERKNKKINLVDSHLCELKLASRALLSLENHSTISFETVKFLLSSESLDLSSFENNQMLKISNFVCISKNLIPSTEYALCVSDSSLASAGGFIILGKNCLKYHYDNILFKSLSIDKLETIASVVGALICSHLKLSCRGIVLLTDNEINRYIIQKSNARCKILKVLTCLLANAMLQQRWWYTSLRISTKNNFIADAISRNKNISSVFDTEYKDVSQDLVMSIVKNINLKTQKMSYVRFLRALVDESDV